MNAKQWQQAIDVALNLVDEINHSDDGTERASSFVAYLVGAVKSDDAALGEKIYAVLRPSTEAVAK